MQYVRRLVFLLLPALVVAACDTSISGSALDNNAPETELSVRDTSLVDNIEDRDRLASTVFVTWSGADPDGYVQAYEVRSYDEGVRPGENEGWTLTVHTDSVMLLPIRRGERFGNAVVEVRAIDNDGIKDATPARTVFPIRNTPPTLRLNTADLPPDTTYPVASFGITARDPEGEENLARIEIALNDSTQFVALPADVEFFTLTGDLSGNPGPTTTARIMLGRSAQPSELSLPNLRLDADNTVYVRAVDQTDTTSTLSRHQWYVKKPKGDVLFVNDYRTSSNANIPAFHLDVLRSYLPAGQAVEAWNVTQPYLIGASVVLVRSSALPNAADPTLRLTLGLFKYIYWVSSNVTGSAVGLNLPFAANVMTTFFEGGGRIMVISPVTAPVNPDESASNPARLLLPISNVFALPDTVTSIRLLTGGDLVPTQNVPGLGVPLPRLEARLLMLALPFEANGSRIVPLYEGEFSYVPASGGGTRRWTGPSTVAAMTVDQRVGFFGLELVSPTSGATLRATPEDPTATPAQAIHLMLQGLGFPR